MAALLSLSLGGLGAARAQDSFPPAAYGLYSLVPAVRAAPGLTAGIKLSGGQEFVFTRPTFLGIDGLWAADDGLSAWDRPRATYRYAWFTRTGWDIKIGLTTTLGLGAKEQGALSLAPEHLRTGTLPSMHLSGQGRLADRWLLSVSAEGLYTGRGQGLDMDLRIDYRLNSGLSVFGSYRLTDSSGEVPDFYGFVPANSARLGVRLRF